MCVLLQLPTTHLPLVLEHNSRRAHEYRYAHLLVLW